MKPTRSLREAVSAIPSGSSIAFGGFQLNRAPMALVRELIRQKKRRLRLLLLPNPLPLDFLVGAGTVAFAEVAFAGLEVANRSLVPPSWQAAVARRGLHWRERDAIYLIQALRAAALGVPFLPLPINLGVCFAPDVAQVRNPFGRSRVLAVQSLQPDVALIHAQVADRQGNVWIEDPVTDELVARASRKVIVTAETIVSRLRRATLPSVMVDSIIHVPGGAWPTSCVGHYGEDGPHIAEYLAVARAGRYHDYVRHHVGARERLRKSSP